MKIAICFLLAALTGNCAAASPGQTINMTAGAVLETLADASLNEATKRRQVKAIIGKHFDYRAMSSRVLATNWQTADKAQRARFTRLFKELLSNTYWAKISGYTNERVEQTGERMRSAKLATVNTLIKTDTVDIPVDYKLYKRDSGWFVYDVVIEQMSLVRNYRGSFQQIVRDEGIDGLLDHLETKVAESSIKEDERAVP